MAVSLFLICRTIKLKKMTGQLYLFTALWVCVSSLHRVLNASTTGTELPCVFLQLFPSLRHRTDVNNGTAGWCPVGPYVFSGLDHHYESLSLSFENQMCLCCYIFLKSLINESVVWMAELQ